jgi:hypothetical protein
MIAFCDFIPQRQSKREYENFHVTVRSELTARSWRCWMPPNKGFQPTRLNRAILQVKVACAPTAWEQLSQSVSERPTHRPFGGLGRSLCP